MSLDMILDARSRSIEPPQIIVECLLTLGKNIEKNQTNFKKYQTRNNYQNRFSKTNFKDFSRNKKSNNDSESTRIVTRSGSRSGSRPASRPDTRSGVRPNIFKKNNTDDPTATEFLRILNIISIKNIEKWKPKLKKSIEHSNFNKECIQAFSNSICKQPLHYQAHIQIYLMLEEKYQRDLQHILVFLEDAKETLHASSFFGHLDVQTKKQTFSICDVVDNLSLNPLFWIQYVNTIIQNDRDFINEENMKMITDLRKYVHENIDNSQLSLKMVMYDFLDASSKNV